MCPGLYLFGSASILWCRLYQRLWPYWKSECQWAPFRDVSVTNIKPYMFLLSKFLFCIEYCRIVDTYYRQNKKVTVITLVWSVCSDWITASELDSEIIRCRQLWNNVTRGKHRGLSCVICCYTNVFICSNLIWLNVKDFVRDWHSQEASYLFQDVGKKNKWKTDFTKIKIGCNNT